MIYYAKKYNFNPHVIKLFLLDHKYKNCLSHLIDQYNNMNEKKKYKYVIGPIVKLPVKTIEYVTDQKENNKLKLKDGLLKYLY
ncbi:hypothetical protein J6P52_05810 [bacterium]|nr:hypothetical protein [bacterium]